MCSLGMLVGCCLLVGTLFPPHTEPFTSQACSPTYSIPSCYACQNPIPEKCSRLAGAPHLELSVRQQTTPHSGGRPQPMTDSRRATEAKQTARGASTAPEPLTEPGCPQMKSHLCQILPLLHPTSQLSPERLSLLNDSWGETPSWIPPRRNPS